jgi:hypothetical protein
MTIFEVWEQWPHYPIASFWTLQDAAKFVADNRANIAFPIIISTYREK